MSGVMPWFWVVAANEKPRGPYATRSEAYVVAAHHGGSVGPGTLSGPTFGESPDITDTHRLAVVREIWKLHAELRNAHMDQTLYEYERRAKERIG